MVGKIRPIHDYIVVARFVDPEEETTESGLILKNSTNDKRVSFGSVLAVGEYALVDGKKEKLKVKIDDVVVYKRYTGTEVKKDLVMLHENEIMGIVEKNEEKKEGGK